MGKRSSFERIERDFYPTPFAAVPPLLQFLRGVAHVRPFCAASRRGARSALASLTRRVEGAVQAAERLNLDGLLALWQRCRGN